MDDILGVIGGAIQPWW